MTLCIKDNKRPAIVPRRFPGLLDWCRQCVNNARRDLRELGLPQTEQNLRDRLEGRLKRDRPRGPCPSNGSRQRDDAPPWAPAVDRILINAYQIADLVAQIKRDAADLSDARLEFILHRLNYTVERQPAGGGQKRLVGHPGRTP